MELADAIRKIFDDSGGTYGSPRVTLELWADGWQVGENTVARLMAELGLAGRKPKRRRSLTRQGKRPAAPDRVGRKFAAWTPNVLWCGDLTEVTTDEGKLYLATVLDLFSRRMLGYVIFHSDRGSNPVFNWSSQHLGVRRCRWAGRRGG